MLFLRAFLVIFLAVLVVYTGAVIAEHGWNLFPFFFGDLARMTWAGQFNLDFAGFLILSAAWTAWRNGYSPKGWALGFLAFFGGMSFLTIYFLYLSYRCDGQIDEMLLGQNHAAARDA